MNSAVEFLLISFPFYIKVYLLKSCTLIYVCVTVPSCLRWLLYSLIYVHKCLRWLLYTLLSIVFSVPVQPNICTVYALVYVHICCRWLLYTLLSQILAVPVQSNIYGKWTHCARDKSMDNHRPRSGKNTIVGKY